MDNEDDVAEVVDEMADELDPVHVLSEANRLGVSVDDLLDRVVAEVKARLS
jgi:hypothetical protein